MHSLRLFGFRSSERNRESDQRRLAKILRAVRLVAFEAEAEARGLRARAVKARKAAGFLSDIDGTKSNDARRAKLKELEQTVLATTPLRFANPSPPSGWMEDFHLQAVDHARHTEKAPLRSGASSPLEITGTAGERVPTRRLPRLCGVVYLRSRAKFWGQMYNSGGKPPRAALQRAEQV